MPVLADLTPVSLGRAVEGNASALWPSWTAWDGVAYEEGDGWRRLLSRIRHPAFNQVFGVRFAGGNPARALDEALSPYRKRKLPCFCWLDPADAHRHGPLLEERGLEHLFAAPGMAAALRQVSPPEAAPGDLAVREVASDDELAAWCGVVSEASGFSADAAAAWLELHRVIPFGPGEKRRHFLATWEDRPAGTSSLLTAAGVAGLYSVTVPRQLRRRGIGTALSMAALQAAGREGFHAAVLVSTAAGGTIYRRLGFREYRRWDCFLLPAS